MIYVDPLFTVPDDCYHGEGAAQASRVGRKNSHQWSHMWCDEGEEEKLHDIARKIGMRREWCQDKKPDFVHYDLVPSRRERALRCGAVEKSLMEWMRERKERNK